MEKLSRERKPPKWLISGQGSQETKIPKNDRTGKPRRMFSRKKE